MKKLLILSGKGGTGKTTTAAAFISFSKAQVFTDCDVDAPNLHLVTGFNGTPENYAYSEKKFIGSKKATIDTTVCNGCGKCMENCKFDAIERKELQGKTQYVTNEMSCEGCGVCAYVCPTNAVRLKDDVAGIVKQYTGERIFTTAELKMGRGTSGKLVSEVKQTTEATVEKLWDSIGNREIEIIDGSPGIGCPVISSVSGVDFVLIVTEPSLSGISDMKRILKTIDFFGVKTAVCINKADSSPENTKEIKKFCRRNHIPFAGKIPYDKQVIKAVNNAQSIAETDCIARDALLSVYKKTMKFMQEL